MKKKTVIIILSILCAVIVLGTAAFFIARATQGKTVVVQGDCKIGTDEFIPAEITFRVPDYMKGKQIQDCSVTVKCVQDGQHYEVVGDGKLLIGVPGEPLSFDLNGKPLNPNDRGMCSETLRVIFMKDVADLEIGEDFEIMSAIAGQYGVSCALLTITEVVAK